jgi:hypothetical protein
MQLKQDARFTDPAKPEQPYVTETLCKFAVQVAEKLAPPEEAGSGNRRSFVVQVKGRNPSTARANRLLTAAAG